MAIRADRNRKQREYRNANKTVRPFVGVDGEGGTILGSHEYLLLRAGDHVLETGEPLGWEECFEFLSGLPGGCIYVSFFFDYDVTMMCRGLPHAKIDRLLDRSLRTIPGRGQPMAIDCGRYQIDYMPHKEFRVRKRLSDEGSKRRYGKWVVISDVGSFFQCSFVSALRRWFGTTDGSDWTPNPGEAQWEDIIDRIEDGKQQRNSFGAVTQDEREYNLLEIRALESLMAKFRTMCDHVGLVPGKWQGPGNLVMAQFRRVGVPRNRDYTVFTDNPGLLKLANGAYYGGRFEALQFGEIDGPVYQYDINSAYARTYADLPCLSHGFWQHRGASSDLPVSRHFVGTVRFHHTRETANLYTLPVRLASGSIAFPRDGKGTYWSPELRLAQDNGCELEWIEGWEYVADCECHWFDWVEELYYERKRIGKNGAGMVLKIMLATIYGKLAQSVGAAPYANPIWAGLITSTVREQLGRAALDDSSGMGADVVMLATDGLFCTEQRSNLNVGGDLGEWDLTVHDEMFVVQSGVYMLSEKLPKTRGVNQRKVIQHTWDFYAAWGRYLSTGRQPAVTVSLRQFIGLKVAAFRGRYDLAGQWIDSDRLITFDWSTKRGTPRIAGTRVLTAPPIGGVASLPYARIIGGGSFRDLDSDQPDWSDAL